MTAFSKVECEAWRPTADAEPKQALAKLQALVVEADIALDDLTLLEAMIDGDADGDGTRAGD